jgi:hypothetical protein
MSNDAYVKLPKNGKSSECVPKILSQVFHSKLRTRFTLNNIINGGSIPTPAQKNIFNI